MRRISLLIVDDDPMDRKAVARTLKSEGLDVHIEEAKDIAGARELIELLVFDCALLDRSLPDGDGSSLIPEIRRRSAATAIVLFTGLHDEEGATEALRAGAQDYVTKDRLELGLAPAIRHAIERQRVDTLNNAERSRLSARSQRDELTGTAGPVGMEQMLRDEQRLVRAHGWPLSAVVLECEGMDALRGFHGRHASDRLLRHIATALSVELRSSDRLGRIDQHRFLALLRCSDGAQALVVADRLVRSVRELRLPGRRQQLGCTATASVVPVSNDVENIADLVERASLGIALGLSKGGDRAVQGAIGGDLPRVPPNCTAKHAYTAVNDRRIKAEIQRIVALDTKALVGWQAVVQSTDESGLQLASMRAAAQISGKSLQFDAACIREALRAVHDPRVASLHIRAQPDTLLQSSDSDTIQRLCEALGTVEVCLQLQVSELPDQLEALALRLQTLRGLGASVALRGVDAGDRSLLAIAALRPWYIIVDADALVADGARDERRSRRLSNLYGAFNATPIATGVATKEQGERLRALGVSYAQGPFAGASELFVSDPAKASTRRRRATIPAR